MAQKRNKKGIYKCVIKKIKNFFVRYSTHKMFTLNFKEMIAYTIY